MIWKDFEASLSNNTPPTHWPVLLQALWYDARGNWNEAHDLVNNLSTPHAAWLHAYLHRVEGDLWNADYWYTRANRKRPDCTLDEERKRLVEFIPITG